VGRGLSDLQKAILRIGYDNRQQLGHLSRYNSDVTSAEVLHYHLGFPLRVNDFGKVASLRGADGMLGGGQMFCVATIGPRRYRAAKASVKKAMIRLRERGLLSQRGLNWCLTDHGYRVVTELMATKAQNDTHL
jgi:hypothetical protein